jgi:Bacterial protein of unknown function (DUF937)
LDISTAIKKAGDSGAFENLARSFGLEPATATPAIDSMFEALALRVERATLSRSGVADVVTLLGNRESGRALSDSNNLAGAAVADAGNGVLDVLIGNKHISRGIAASAASAAGISDDVAKKMLPVVASMMMGALQRQTQPEFARLVRNVPALAVSRNGSPLPLPGEVPMDGGSSSQSSDRGGTWGSDETSDADERERGPQPRSSRSSNGGGPLPLPGDRIPGTGRDQPRGQPRGQPQGQPGGQPQDNPFENLPDIIRRGGVEVPGGGSLENVIRSILGGLLGFQNRGILGSLLQLFLVRFLPAILKRIFSRVVMGR